MLGIAITNVAVWGFMLFSNILDFNNTKTATKQVHIGTVVLSGTMLGLSLWGLTIVLH